MAIMLSSAAVDSYLVLVPSPAVLSAVLLAPFLYRILPLAIPHCCRDHWVLIPKPHVYLFALSNSTVKTQ